MSATLLAVSGLNVKRGATHVLHDVNLDVQSGEIVALIGANGAGKSTLLQSISGLLPIASGEIRYLGENIKGVACEKIVRAGLIHCPEGRQVFNSLSVRENLLMGAYLRNDKAGIDEDIARVHALFPILAERDRVAGGALSGGEQMMLVIGRALLAQPRLLLLDEPSLGLAPQYIERIFEVIAGLRAQGVPILLIEQNAAMALDCADRGYVLEHGKITLSGSGPELSANDRVRQSYLGEAA